MKIRKGTAEEIVVKRPLIEVNIQVAKNRRYCVENDWWKF